MLQARLKYRNTYKTYIQLISWTEKIHICLTIVKF